MHSLFLLVLVFWNDVIAVRAYRECDGNLEQARPDYEAARESPSVKHARLMLNPVPNGGIYDALPLQEMTEETRKAFDAAVFEAAAAAANPHIEESLSALTEHLVDRENEVTAFAAKCHDLEQQVAALETEKAALAEELAALRETASRTTNSPADDGGREAAPDVPSEPPGGGSGTSGAGTTSGTELTGDLLSGGDGTPGPDVFSAGSDSSPSAAQKKNTGRR